MADRKAVCDTVALVEGDGGQAPALRTLEKVTTQEAPNGEGGLLDRPALLLLRVNREVLLYAALIALAAVLRFWDLGSRMLHHDESIHAVYSWYLLTGRGYTHNPTYHGPMLYHLTALMYFLFGAADYTARMAPAIFGTIMVGLPYLLRRQLGRSGALAASFLLALSPAILYYSRSLRHDIFAATGTLAVIIALWRYVDDRQPRWLYLSAAGLVVGFTNHELTFMTVFMLALFLLAVAWRSLLAAARKRDKGALSPWAEYLLFIGTFAAPQFTAAVLLAQRVLNPGAAQAAVGQLDPLLTFAFSVIFTLAAALGLWWNRRVWVYGALIFYIVFALLYTAFLSNPNGFFTGAIGALQYWLTQHDVKRGGQPWFYYLILLPLYEFLPLGFGLGGVIYAALRRHFFGLFLAYWAGLSLVLYSWAGEKMPWLMIHIAIPLVLLAGLAIGRLWDAMNWRALWARGGGFLALWYLLALVVLVAIWNQGSPFTPGLQPLESQRAVYQWLALMALFLGLVALIWQSSGKVRDRAVHVLAFVLLVVTLPLSVRAAWEVNYYHGDIPVEMLVYTQSSPDVGKVIREIERVGFRTGAGQELKVAYDDGVSWPFEWYLRDYKGRNFYGSGMPAADAPIVLVGVENDHDAKVKPSLGNKYVGQRYKLRWWFPEDYRSMTPESIRWFLFDPATRGRIWRYFLYRETVNPLGSTDFVMYERRDLVAGVWNVTATTGAAAPPEEDQYLKQARQVTAVQAWGTAGSGEGQLAEPKNLAVDADGSVYVVDSRNHRVQKFDRNGRFVTSWGSNGTGNGQFTEPWGIAVSRDGTVYVADTWNHRVQKFDAAGNFRGKWGKYANVMEGAAGPGDFFGPRAVAVDAQGNVYVADTGNHRVQKFDKDGKFLAVYGTRGAGDGQFNEPVGIFVDQSGLIYVADTWNHRVQKFDGAFKPLAQWSMAGWQSESPSNKPYLVADSAGNVYVSDPENQRIVKFSATGTVLAVWGKLGSDNASLRLPTGLGIDASGNLFVADTQNNRIVKFGPVQ